MSKLTINFTYKYKEQESYIELIKDLKSKGWELIKDTACCNKGVIKYFETKLTKIK